MAGEWTMGRALAEKLTGRQFWHSTWLGVVDIVTPPRCLACKANVTAGASLCLACWQKLSFIEEPCCQQLGIPFEYDQGEGALSPEAIADPPPWDRARAAVTFNDTSKELIHLLKYRDTHEAGIAMARMMARAGRKLIAEADVLLPVPLHRFRLWQRRFNQAAVLCQHIAKHAGKTSETSIIERAVATRQQVGLTADERRRNVRKAFSVHPQNRRRIEGKTVLLIDDVRTTGATAAACATALKSAGAAQVDVLTFALVLEPARLHIEA